MKARGNALRRRDATKVRDDGAGGGGADGDADGR